MFRTRVACFQFKNLRSFIDSVVMGSPVRPVSKSKAFPPITPAGRRALRRRICNMAEPLSSDDSPKSLSPDGSHRPMLTQAARVRIARLEFDHEYAVAWMANFDKIWQRWLRENDLLMQPSWSSESEAGTQELLMESSESDISTEVYLPQSPPSTMGDTSWCSASSTSSDCD